MQKAMNIKTMRRECTHLADQLTSEAAAPGTYFFFEFEVNMEECCWGIHMLALLAVDVLFWLDTTVPIKN